MVADNSRKHSPLRIAINGKLVPQSQYTVETIDRSVGGGAADTAAIIAERAPDLYLQNASLRPQEIEAQLSIFNGSKRVFWGVVEGGTFAVGDDPDDKRLIASIQDWHYGPPITGAQYCSVNIDNAGKNTNTVESTTMPIVFNGFVDASRAQVSSTTGTIPVNKTIKAEFQAKRRDGTRSTSKCHMLIPVEAVQTDLGVVKYTPVFLPFQLGGESINSSAWTLRDAVRYLCTLGNTEAYIKNPGDADYNLLPEFILPRTELKVDEHLPKLLDEMLTPYGYTWYVDVGDGPDAANKPAGGILAGAANAVAAAIAAAVKAAGKPQIRFIKFGSGTEVNAKLAKVGSDASFATTNLCGVQLDYSIAETINEVHVIGGQFAIEGTFELYRVSEDKWVANEAGDYFTSAFDPFHLPNTDEVSMGASRVPVPKLSLWFPDSLLGAMAGSAVVSRVQTRRRFRPVFATSTSTTGDVQPKGPHNGFLIEVIDLAQEDVAESAKEWMPIDKITDPMFRHIRVLHDECGIVFDRGLPEGDDGDEQDQPENFFLKALGSNARMRITASVEGDFATQVVVARSTPGAKSPSTNKTTFVWHDPDRWPCRRVLTSGRYKSKYADDATTAKTPTVDEIILDMRRAAREVLSHTDAARIGGTITFNNFGESVFLGGIVKKIAGRELTMGTRVATDQPYYPQVLAIRWSPERAEISAALSAEPGIGLEFVQ